MTLKINVTGMNTNKYSSIKVSAIQRLLCSQTRKCEPNTDHYTTHMVLMRSKMTIFVGNTTFFFWIALWLTFQLSPKAPLIKTALTEGGEVQANLSLQYYPEGKNTMHLLRNKKVAIKVPFLSKSSAIYNYIYTHIQVHMCKGRKCNQWLEQIYYEMDSHLFLQSKLHCTDSNMSLLGGKITPTRMKPPSFTQSEVPSSWQAPEGCLATSNNLTHFSSSTISSGMSTRWQKTKVHVWLH